MGSFCGKSISGHDTFRFCATVGRTSIPTKHCIVLALKRALRDFARSLWGNGQLAAMLAVTWLTGNPAPTDGAAVGFPDLGS